MRVANAEPRTDSGSRRFLNGWISCLRLVGLVALVGLAAGCASSGNKVPDEPSAVDEPPPLSEGNKDLARGALSAVEIHGQKLVTVQETVESVFTAAGLTLGKRAPDQMVFERPASRQQTAAYGSWFGGQAKVRLKVDFMPQGNGVMFLRCRSFIAREAGTMSEDEQPLARRHVKEYEPLLSEVANRLN